MSTALMDARPQPVRLPDDEARSQSLDTFDAATARGLKPGHWITFAGMPGLRMSVSGKTRTFSYRYRSPVDGRVRQVRIGNWPATPWEKAVTRWAELRDKRDDGLDPQLERRERRAAARAAASAQRAEAKQAAISVRDVCELYLREHVAVECKTEKARYDAKRLFEGRVFPKLGDKPAHTIGRSDAADFLAQVKIDAPQTARLLRSRLGGAWSHAIDRKMLPEGHANPWREALRGKLKAEARTRVLDDAELAAMLPKLRAVEDGTARDALLLTLMLGARSGEVASMEWSAIDLKRGAWKQHDTKTGVERTVMLPKQAVAILKARGEGFAIPQQDLSAAIREHESFGLRAFTPHDLRRSCRTGLSRLGVRDEVAEAALGHVEGGVRGVYNLHRFEKEVGEALQLWCDRLDALTAPEVVPMPKRPANARKRT